MTKENIFENKRVKELLQLAIEEDCVENDLTTQLAVPEGIQAHGRIIAREELIFCGAGLIEALATQLNWSLRVLSCSTDGHLIPAGETLAEIEGSARHLLALERTILNFLQRLSGVATYTDRFVTSSGVIPVSDTRKTIPGWRALDKYATAVGGARNHRLNLADMLLVKNNHIDANGSLQLTLERILKNKPAHLKLEVEVRNKEELQIALAYPVDLIMLDNMNDDEIFEAVELVEASGHKCLLEISGGITPARLRGLNSSRIAYASSGALTTQARNVDISMRIDLLK